MDSEQDRREEEDSYAERRKHRRDKVELPLEYRVGDGPRRPASCGNMSLGGMFLTVDDPHPKGTRLTLYLQLLGAAEEVVIPAVVRWNRPGGMGVQYVSLDQKQLYVLMDIMASADRGGVKLG